MDWEEALLYLLLHFTPTPSPLCLVPLIVSGWPHVSIVLIEDEQGEVQEESPSPPTTCIIMQEMPVNQWIINAFRVLGDPQIDLSGWSLPNLSLDVSKKRRGCFGH